MQPSRKGQAQPKYKVWGQAQAQIGGQAQPEDKVREQAQAHAQVGGQAQAQVGGQAEPKLKMRKQEITVFYQKNAWNFNLSENRGKSWQKTGNDSFVKKFEPKSEGRRRAEWKPRKILRRLNIPDQPLPPYYTL